MLRRPTISNEKSIGRVAWYTLIKVPVGKAFGVSCPPGFCLDLGGDDGPTLFSAAHPNGGAIPLQIPDTPYKPAHPQSLSLEDCDGTWDAPTLEFEAVEFMTFDGLETGQFNESMPIAIYHAHVLTSVAVRLTRVEDDKYTLRCEGKGSHLTKAKKEEGYTNDPPLLGAPVVPRVSLTTMSFAEPGATQPRMVQNTGQFTKQELMKLSADGRLAVVLNLSLPRDSLSLDKIIDLNKKSTVSEACRKVVETILRGEKPPGANWTLEGSGFGPTRRYHIHKAVFTAISQRTRENMHMFANGLMYPLDDEGIQTAIRIAYGVEVPLPDKVTKLQTTTLQGIFQDVPIRRDIFVDFVIPQWEREICRRALALNPHDPTPASLVELLNLLNVIWETKYGRFPVAKRVVIGVLADMVHLNTRSSVFDFVQNAILPRFPDSNLAVEHLPSVLGAMMMHLNGVSGVRKYGIDPASGDFGRPPTVSLDPTPAVPEQPTPTVSQDPIPTVTEHPTLTVPEQSILTVPEEKNSAEFHEPPTVSPNELLNPAEEAEPLTLLSDSTEEEEKIEIDEDTVEKKDTVDGDSDDLLFTEEDKKRPGVKMEDTVEQEDTVEVAAREDWYDAESGGVENPDENQWTCTIS